MTTNLHEQIARERKAAAISDALAEAGFAETAALALDTEQRILVAQIAGQRPPSETTWARALELLAHRYAVRAALRDDPFVGLS